MTQTLNILRKDIRYLRLEILASFALLILFSIVDPKTWVRDFANGADAGAFEMFLTYLLYISWAVLILRVVHAERLPGLNQFWTTRPYEWPSLLAAKSLFVLLVLYIPFLLLQIYLLHRAGSAVGPNLFFVVHNLILLTALFVLPMACIAVVTKTFAQTILAFLGAAVAAAGVSVAFAYLGSISATLGMQRRAPLFLLTLLIGIALVLFSATLLLQYSRRTTGHSIGLLCSTALLLFLTQLVLKGSSAAATGYAASVANPPASASITPTAHTGELLLPKNPRTAVYKIPLTFSNFTPGAIVSRNAMRYTLTAADGYTWTSDWVDDFGGLQPTGSGNAAQTRANIDLPWRLHDRFIGSPVSLHIDFLVSQLEDGPTYNDTVAEDEHAVPGIGVCSLYGEDHTVVCRSAFGQTGSVTAKTFGTSGPCSTPSSPSPADRLPVTGFFVGRMGIYWTPTISPIFVSELRLRRPHRPDNSWNDTSINPCSGDPIAFTTKNFLRRVQLQTPSATITLKDAPLRVP